MTVNVVALGDLHLAPGGRNDDRRAALDYAIADAQARGPVHLWLHGGDLNDARMSIDDRNYLIDRFSAMAAVAPVVVTPGNHDLPGDPDFLARLRTTYPITVVTTPRVVLVDVASGTRTVAIFGLPYPSKASIVAAGTPHAEISAVAAKAFDAIFMAAADDLERCRLAGMLTGALGHVSINGSVASTGQPQIGAELEIDATHLARLGDCFKVFNHIHKHQSVHGAIYPGSMCRLDWGETEQKGYLWIECDYADGAIHDGARVVPTSAWTHRETFMPIPVAPMYHVESTLTRDAFDWSVRKGPDGPADEPPQAQAVRDLLMPSIDWSGCDVRVRARYPQPEKAVLSTARERIAKEFGGARRLQIELIAVPERALRAPEVATEQTLDGKLRAWARLSGVEWTDAIDGCLDRLQRSDDPDVVSGEVASRLERLAAVDEPVASAGIAG